ncbi:MAG: hypothetical protein M3362_26730, partial [Acidobacteriota bacterium]|nr:hypothetical protein [Acidobacteriota bacterium]
SYSSRWQRRLTGEEYEIDFGSEEKNEAFKEAIKHGYDGHEHGIPFSSALYNPHINNGGEGLCRAVENLGLPPDNSFTPWVNRN